MAAKPIVIALAGNPNSGKTSLYNSITGSRQHVGNYPGVTVEKKTGTVRVDDAIVTFIDLPGTYNLSPYTPEEYITRKELLSPSIDAIIIVIDTTNLERQLYFASQVIEIKKPVVIALNMFDEFEKSGQIIDVSQLSAILGVPCVRTVGSRGKGVTELMSISLKAAREEIPATGKPPVYSHEMEHAIEAIHELIPGRTKIDSRWTAINLLLYNEADLIQKDMNYPGIADKISEIQNKLEHLEGRSISALAASGRYGYASGAAAECIIKRDHQPDTLTDRIDMIVTHRLLGIPIFLVVLWLMFQIMFAIGGIPIKWLESFFSILSSSIIRIIPEGALQSLIVDGVIAGVGGVIMFLPTIMLLFLFITILEDTGYMARAAFIMDRIMHAFGMHGKSFLPMLIGFGCTVPAIMSTRILENKKDRMITMFILPFMSCGARLPVYILLAGAFFGQKNAGNIIFSIYLFGIALSLIVAKIASFASGPSSPFVMELPPYRLPTLRSVRIHIWERSYLYLRKAGTIILAASVILWALMTYPKPPDHADNTNAIEYTYAGKLGKAMEPVLKPLGFDWKIGISLTAGLAAKEIIVSTLGTVYSLSGENSENQRLESKMMQDPSMNPAKAYALMLFILIYVPCAAVLATVKRETGSWKLAGFMGLYTVGLAWVISYIFLKLSGLVF